MRIMICRIPRQRNLESSNWVLMDQEDHGVETKNLGDVALFLGENSSMSVMASNIAGCQGNCIYFSPIKGGFSTPTYEPKDMGVYNLESGTITSFAIDPEIIAKFYIRSPIWVSQWYIFSNFIYSVYFYLFLIEIIVQFMLC